MVLRLVDSVSSEAFAHFGPFLELAASTEPFHVGAWFTAEMVPSQISSPKRIIPPKEITKKKRGLLKFRPSLTSEGCWFDLFPIDCQSCWVYHLSPYPSYHSLQLPGSFSSLSAHNLEGKKRGNSVLACAGYSDLELKVCYSRGRCVGVDYQIERHWLHLPWRHVHSAHVPC